MDTAPAMPDVPSPGSQRRAEMRLPGRPTSVSAARTFVVRLLQGWGVQDHLIEDAGLLTSELLTNAVTHGTGVIELQVCREDDLVRVTVHDDADELPVLSQTGPTSSGGRGIQLVVSIAQNWGVDVPESKGKAVWFELTTQQKPQS